MRKSLAAILAFAFVSSVAQNKTAVSWIDSKAIPIENANPDSELLNFDRNKPQKFTEARVFGFGEATHHCKEFFDLKAKFFKYLVEHQGVTAFIMEESYQAESGINEWLKGGKGDAATISGNFNIMPWKCREVAELLQWMRDYNVGKPEERQVRFYGMDVQFGKNINDEIRNFVASQKIEGKEELLAALDSCSKKVVDYRNPDSDWANRQLPKINAIAAVISDYQKRSGKENDKTFQGIFRAINHLKNYTLFVSDPKTDVRDNGMFDNVKWILEHEEIDRKAFIWAHNEHVNNEYVAPGFVNLGNRLKAEFGDAYYSVGFDFGAGTLRGIELKSGKIVGWKQHKLEKPYKNTFAETLFAATPEIYFLDLSEAGTEESKFFLEKRKYLAIGAPGFDPKKPVFPKRIYADSYDALIFVKWISGADYGK